jgi:hypothetical protein
MQLLQLGGYPLCVDNLRAPDTDNPKGYYEYEPVRSIHRDASFMSAAEGKAIKVVSHLLQFLPPQYDYRVLFVERDLSEVLLSQQKMISRLRGVPVSCAGDGALSDIDLYRRHLIWIRDWLGRQENIETFYLSHAAILNAPREAAVRLNTFLWGSLALDRMSGGVDPALYRSREEQSVSMTA